MRDDDVARFPDADTPVSAKLYRTTQLETIERWYGIGWSRFHLRDSRELAQYIHLETGIDRIFLLHRVRLLNRWYDGAGCPSSLYLQRRFDDSWQISETSGLCSLSYRVSGSEGEILKLHLDPVMESRPVVVEAVRTMLSHVSGDVVRWRLNQVDPHTASAWNDVREQLGFAPRGVPSLPQVYADGPGIQWWETSTLLSMPSFGCPKRPIVTLEEAGRVDTVDDFTSSSSVLVEEMDPVVVAGNRVIDGRNLVVAAADAGVPLLPVQRRAVFDRRQLREMFCGHRRVPVQRTRFAV